MFEDEDEDMEMELSNSDEAISDEDLSFTSDVDSLSFDPNFFRSYYKQNSWIQFSHSSLEKKPSDSEITKQVIHLTSFKSVCSIFIITVITSYGRRHYLLRIFAS